MTITLKLLENLEEMFPWYYLHSDDVFNMYKYSTTKYDVTHREKGFKILKNSIRLRNLDT